MTVPASFVWQPGPNGGTPANAANLNRLAIVADIGTAGTPTGDALKAAYATTGPTDPGPLLPPGTEYVWMKTDGAGNLLDILAGMS